MRVSLVTSPESRLRRLKAQLEKRDREAERWVSAAIAAIKDATASLEQYAVMFSVAIEENRLHLAAMAPLAAACVKAGINIHPCTGVVAFPPDNVLPKTLHEQVQLFRGTATMPLAQPYGRRQQVTCTADDPRSTDRRDAAMAYLILGDDQGLVVRNLGWRAENSRWINPPPVDEAAHPSGFTLQDVSGFFDCEPASSRWTPNPDDLNDRLHRDSYDGNLRVSFRDLAELVDSAGVHDQWACPTWSDRVKSGHGPVFPGKPASVSGVLPDS